jgi:hypothetical protein
MTQSISEIPMLYNVIPRTPVDPNLINSSHLLGSRYALDVPKVTIVSRHEEAY